MRANLASISACLFSLNYGLEIKTPTGHKVVQGKVMPGKELYGALSTYVFGDNTLNQLVYDFSYMLHVLHHATVANLDYMLFEVTIETRRHMC